MITSSSVRLAELTAEHPTAADRAVATNGTAVRLLWLARVVVRRAPALATIFVGLGAVLHFLPGRPVLTVDSFFHLSNAFSCAQDTQSWTYLTSIGQPNASLGQLPADCSIALLQATPLPLWVTEALFEALLAMGAAAGMYLSARTAGRLVAVNSRVAAIVAALFWVANPFSLAYVWYHVLYVQVLWAGLPWLFLFVLAAAGDGKVARLCLGSFIVGVAASPGLTQAELPQTFLVMGFLCWFVGVSAGRRALLRSVLVVGSCGSALMWWLLPSLTNLGNFYSTATKNQSTAAILDFASHYSSIWHLLTLTAVPQLYQTVNGTPYIAWSGLVTSEAGELVLGCIPLLAAVGIARAWRNSSNWKQIASLAAMLALGVIVCKGKTQPLPATGVMLTRLPLGAIFRQPLNNFSLLVVLPLTLFVGLGTATVLRIAATSGTRAYRGIAGGLSATVLVGALALIVAPWWSSHVFPVGGGVFPSARYVLPDEYREVGDILAGSPSGGKTLVLPFTRNEQSAFVWPAGIQPNGDPLFEVWQRHRSVLENDAGITDSPGFEVARCIAVRRPNCLRMAESLGVDRIVVHKDWNAAYFGPKSKTAVVSSGTALAYLLDNRSRSSRAIDRSREREVAVHRSGTVSLWIHVRSMPRQADRFVSFDRYYVQLNRKNFFGLYSPSRSIWSPGPVLPRSPYYYLTLKWSSGKLQLWINGQPEGQPVPFRGPPPKSVHVLPPGRAPGTWRATSGVVRLSVPRASCGIIPCRLRGGAKVLQWGKYLALVSLPHAEPLLSSRPCRKAAPAATLPPLLEGGTFVIGRGGCERVVFRETYDKSWTLAATNSDGRVTSHRLVNQYYNQWTVSGSAGAVYSLRYSGNSRFLASSVAGALIGLAYPGCVFGGEVIRRRRRPAGRHRARGRSTQSGRRSRLAIHCRDEDSTSSAARVY